MGASVTTNSGGGWTRFNFGALQGMAYTIAMDPTNHSVLYAGGYEYTTTYVPTIYKTTNAGTSWTKLAGTGLAGYYVYTLVIDPNNPNTLLAGTSSTVYKSTDGGNTWATSGFTGGSTKTLAVLVSARATTIYAGTYSNGVYSTTDVGSTWTQMNTGLNDLRINSLKISSDQYLFAGTYGGSVYRWWLPIGCEEMPGNIESSSITFKVSPNPFSGKAIITYQLPKAAELEISIYDIRGCLIKTLEKTLYTGGIKAIQWNGCDGDGVPVPAGVYFCKLITGDQTRMEKLVIMR